MSGHDWNEHHARQGHAHAHGHGHGSGPELPWSSAELAGFLAGLPERPRRAIDLGCGTGADAVFLAEQGIAAAGIDGSEVALAQARRRAEEHDVDVEWLQGDVLELPLEDGCMDLVLDRGCLHHVPAEDHVRYAAEVARVLRPGGTLLVREMNRAGHHEHAVSEDGIRTMVEEAPLRVRSIVTYGAAGGDGEHRTMLAVLDRD